MQRARAVQPKGRPGGRKSTKPGAVAVICTLPIVTMPQALARCRVFRQEAATEATDKPAQLLAYSDMLRRCISDFSANGIHCLRQVNVHNEGEPPDIVAVFIMPNKRLFCIGLTTEWGGDVIDRPTPRVAAFSKNIGRATKGQGATPRGVEDTPAGDGILF